MSYAQEWRTIAGLIAAEWDATVIAWPGVGFDPPTDGSSWVRVTTRGVDAFQAGLAVGAGARRFRHAGMVFGQVFVADTPTGGAKEAALALADDFAAIFREADIAGFRFRAPRADDVGSDGHGWYQVNVLTEFERDSTF